jgi:hypothetical protein
MAHLGKRYPLAFRRDLAYDVGSNQSAWGRAYWFEAPFLGGSIPAAMSLATLPLVEVPPAGFYALWESGWRPVAGRSVFARMYIDTASRQARVFEAKWELRDSVKGFIGKATVVGKAGLDYSVIECICEMGPDPSPPLWEVGLRPAMTGFALTWPEWHAL